MVTAAADLPIVAGEGGARPIWAVQPSGLDELVGKLSAAQAAYLGACAFQAKAGEVVLLPGGDGIAAAVLGLGEAGAPQSFGALPFGLPEGAWMLQAGGFDPAEATLWFCLGAYGYTEYKAARRPPAKLVSASNHTNSHADGLRRAIATAASVWMVRDLINRPANVLGPAELADAAADVATMYGARFQRIQGAELTSQYPTIDAVGRGSDRAPVVAAMTWRGSGADDSSPLIALCGKGVCFDTGGYDIKPSSAMLRMKKDMGGAATILGLARMLMDADTPIRLEVRLGCVENSISGRAMRPLDVIRTRRGLTVEVGNTDAEGRLVLCDLLAETSDLHPALVVDCATLTGAARTAVGPDLPVLFCNDETWAKSFEQAGLDARDPVWRLPLWAGYDGWLDSQVADLNNVSEKSQAGAITAALFMQRFIAPCVPWAHIDLYAWNDAPRHGRPAGGEAQAMRALFQAIETTVLRSAADRNTVVT